MIIIFNGPPGVGKDNPTIDLYKSYGATHLSFKEALFQEVFDYFGVSEEWFMDSYNNRDVKENKVEERLGGRTRREAMIYVSEEYIKPKYGKRYFGDKVAAKIEPEGFYVFSDGGFVEEIQPLIDKCGPENVLVVRIIRDGYGFVQLGDSRRYINGWLRNEYVCGKPSELNQEEILDTQLDCVVYDLYNNSDLAEYEKTLKQIYSDIREKRERCEFL